MTILMTSGSASRAVAITAADTDLTNPIRGLYVGTTGNVSVVTTRGDSVVIPTVPAGTIIPLEIRRVATASTASGFVGFFD